MTSEQQVKTKFKICWLDKSDNYFLVKVMVQAEVFVIGYGVSTYRAYTDAMLKLGMKVSHYNKRKGIYAK